MLGGVNDKLHMTSFILSAGSELRGAERCTCVWGLCVWNAFVGTASMNIYIYIYLLYLYNYIYTRVMVNLQYGAFSPLHLYIRLVNKDFNHAYCTCPWYQDEAVRWVERGGWGILLWRIRKAGNPTLWNFVKFRFKNTFWLTCITSIPLAQRPSDLQCVSCLSWLPAHSA